MAEVITQNKLANRAYLKPTRNQSSLVDLSLKFASISRPTSKDISLFQEQFYTLILNTDSLERQKIAQAIAHCEYVPKPLIIFMAMEEIAIAKSPLLLSPILKPADLNMLISKSSIEQAKVIARRSNLDASNISALLKMDNEAGQIKHILRGNTSLLGDSEIIQLLNNSDTSYAWVEEVPDNITTHDIKMERTPTGAKDLSDMLVKLASRAGKLRHKPAGKEPKSLSSAITLKQIEKQLLSCTRLNDHKSFAVSIEYFCGLNNQTTLNFLKEQNAGMIATLLRALEISNVTAARILLMVNHELGRNLHVFKLVMDKYKKLDQAECEAYFTKLGADFAHSHYKEVAHKPTTRYALSLAARERRALLLRRQEKLEDNVTAMKLSA